ncbi:hypothetical protein GIB67_012698 [Kingdonia uniflora]|uniref:Uncharacterized protein n=1 Tax=Kingdonia uniflora TaxID=39325 RepID=A0A7J7NF07_9MAGN|nr:hypothetical protein GIB67_012698 [Kingdonia uniflora]
MCNLSYRLNINRRKSYSGRARLQIQTQRSSSAPNSTLDLIPHLFNNITPHYEGARGRGTRGDYNLFKLILRAIPISDSDSMIEPHYEGA